MNHLRHSEFLGYLANLRQSSSLPRRTSFVDDVNTRTNHRTVLTIERNFPVLLDEEVQTQPCQRSLHYRSITLARRSQCHLPNDALPAAPDSRLCVVWDIAAQRQRPAQLGHRGVTVLPSPSRCWSHSPYSQPLEAAGSLGPGRFSCCCLSLPNVDACTPPIVRAGSGTGNSLLRHSPIIRYRYAQDSNGRRLPRSKPLSSTICFRSYRAGSTTLSPVAQQHR